MKQNTIRLLRPSRGLTNVLRSRLGVLQSMFAFLGAFAKAQATKDQSRLGVLQSMFAFFGAFAKALATIDQSRLGVLQ